MTTRRKARDLTVKEIWVLIKHFLTDATLCALLFGLPYMFLRGIESALVTMIGNDASYWMGMGLSAVVILFVLVDDFDSLSRYFADLAQLSLLNRWVMVILALLYLHAWSHWPEFTFFFTFLFLPPAATTYDEYARLLKEKPSPDDTD